VKRHELDLFSLVAGLAFVSVAVLYLLDSAGVLGVDGRLVVPLMLIALGIGGLAGALYRMTRDSRRRERAAEPAPEEF
jgi:cytochrome c oxidase subunit IV